MTALCALWTIASILTLAIRGDLSEPWNVVDGSSAMVSYESVWDEVFSNFLQFERWLGIEIVAAILEFTLWLLSIYFIWNLHMPLSKRASVAAIFACRLPYVNVLYI